jgi:hypothetical protein
MGRYNDTLSHTLSSILAQTYKNFDLFIFDDNENPIDLRTMPVYAGIFSRFEQKGIEWHVVYGEKKGQVFNHQKSIEVVNGSWIWRVDDDECPEPNVLETLVGNIEDGVGAVACSVIDPLAKMGKIPEGLSFNKLASIFSEPNCQWFEFSGKKEVEHLYSSFLYNRKAAKEVGGYNLRLSRVGHREETMFSNMLFRHGYKLIVDPSVKVWHYRNPQGGIRAFNDKALFDHDEAVFAEYLKTSITVMSGITNIVLNEGLGDHLCFKMVWDKHKAKVKTRIFCTYPEVFQEEGIELHSIGEALSLFGNIESFSVYKFLIDEFQKGRKLTLSEAFEQLYFGGKN